MQAINASIGWIAKCTIINPPPSFISDPSTFLLRYPDGNKTPEMQADNQLTVEKR
jgi:hypothetical protein